MKLTTKSEYALLSLIYIARRGRNRYVKIEDICKEYSLSKKYLEQIFYSLKQARYMKTRRGASGGYTLATPADRISIAQVIRLMDGALAPSLAVSKYFYSNSPLEKEKNVMTVLREIRDYISNRFEHLKLSELV